jgi:hypothetical protein
MNMLVRAGLLVLVASLIAAASASFMLSRHQIGQEAIAQPPSLRISSLPIADKAAGPSLIERSPFAQNRSAFARNAGPPAPEIEVKLAGLFKMGKEMRASLVIGGQSVVVRKGDETPVGKVASIEASAIVLEGPSPRRIELFKP